MPAIGAACARLRDAGIRVALFIDPDRAQVHAAHAAGAPVVELHTGRYAEAAEGAELARVADAARHARALGLEVHAGHGLTNENVGAVAAIPDIIELNIGHAIIADAVFIGLAAAVARMRRAIELGRGA